MAMASKVKPWREAATLILTAHLGGISLGASKASSSKTTQSLQGSKDLDHGYLKKDKLGLPPGAKDNTMLPKKITPITCDYSTLLLTRNVNKNTFFAGSLVFPGGVIDKSDFSSKWMELFSRAGYQHPADFGEIVDFKRDRPPVLDNRTDSSLPPDVAFRICAIRETFEESGVLLVRSVKDCDPSVLSGSGQSGKRGVPFGSVFEHVNLTNDEVISWRSSVHQDAAQFIQLCETFQVLPDIWALAEWSNWLTPSDNKKRYDTMFYMCSLDSIPDTQHDEKETIHSQWMTPIDALTKYCNEELYLPPPQIYELQRLCHYGQQRALHKFTSDRAFKGCQRFLPVRCNSSDGLMSILPGDDLYPENPVLHHLAPSEILTTDQTLEQSSRACRHLHRFEFRTVADYKLTCNFPLPYNHIGPKQIFEEDDVSSKL